MSELTIIGLGGREPESGWESFKGRRVLARNRAVAQAALPRAVKLDAAFDGLFNQDDLTGVADEIADELLRQAKQRDVVYLVPGVGLVGDLTVEQLVARADELVLAPGEHLLAAGGDAQLQIVDALALAVAEQTEPFGAGGCPLDPTVPTMVTNWHGATVTRLAERRLRERHGYGEPFEPDDDGNLYLAPLPALDATASLAALQHIYARLRRPDGCPWDREQTALMTVPHIVEEAEELREALERGDWEHAAEELGDVLGNVVMIAQIAREQGQFDFDDALAAISAKLVRRHPHVFGDAQASNPDEVLEIWNQVKQQERAQAGAPQPQEGQGTR